MTRETVYYTVEENNKDHGKTFAIELMSAWDTEKWASEAIFSLVQGPGGLEELSQLGFFSLFKIPYTKYEELIGRLLKCAQYVPDLKQPHVMMKLFPEHFEEAATIFKLKKFILEQHMSFYTGANPLK